jgi:hypothetical protein
VIGIAGIVNAVPALCLQLSKIRPRAIWRAAIVMIFTTLQQALSKEGSL